MNLRAVVKRLDGLLRPEREQHADHDDADLADELAPAVNWLRQMEMHAAIPPRPDTGLAGSEPAAS